MKNEGMDEGQAVKPFSPIPNGNALDTQNYSLTYTPTSPSTAYITPFAQFQYAAGAVVNFTVRIGMPQLEQSSYATSVIATSSGATTRAADLYSVPSGGTYFNSAGVLKTAPVNTPRLDYGSSGGNYPLGVLIEESRTNGIRNNTMQGAVPADGIERTTSGTFSGCTGSTCAGWTTNLNGGTGSVSYASNTATLTGDGTSAASIYQAITTVSGYLYNITVTNGTGNVVTVQAGTTAGGTNLLAVGNGGSAAAATTTSYQFYALGTTSYVQINNVSATSANVTGISVQSGGQLPTHFNVSGCSTNFCAQGLQVKVANVGTSLGITYFDLSISGTTNGSGFTNIGEESSSQIAASSGQTWCDSAYLAISGGSTTNINKLSVNTSVNSSSNSYLGELLPSTSWLGSSSKMALNYACGTVSYSTAAYLGPYFQFTYNNGVPINITLRIGMPQIENGNGETNPTSTIPTYGSAVTRNTDTFYVQGTANGTWLTNNVGTLGTVGSLPYAKGSNNAGFAGLDDGTANNAIFTRITSSLQRGVGMYSGGSSVYNQSYAGYTVGATTKSVFAFSTSGGGDEGAANDGVLQPDGTVALPTTQSELTIGHTRRGDGDFDGWVQRVWYMPTRQPDSSLADYSR